jgi:hypothetical protein
MLESSLQVLASAAGGIGDRISTSSRILRGTKKRAEGAARLTTSEEESDDDIEEKPGHLRDSSLQDSGGSFSTLPRPQPGQRKPALA